MTITSQVALPTQLAGIAEELLALRDRAHRVCEGLDEGVWVRQPADGGWSIGQCLTHLNVTSERFMPLIDDAIRHGREQQLEGQGPFGCGLLGRALIWYLEPPYRLKSKTIPPFEPVHVDPMAATLERFDYLQRELQARVERSSGLALDRLRMVSPFNAKLTYNLYTAFRLLSAHQRRHLWQAEQTRARPAS